LVIGEVDSILGNLDEEGGFEELVLNLWMQAADNESRGKALDDLGDTLARSREEYADIQKLDQKIFSDQVEA
jgi:hypothetical protein